MIAMKMADKNMIDPMKFNFVAVHLNQGTFSKSTKKPLMKINHLSLDVVDKSELQNYCLKYLLQISSVTRYNHSSCFGGATVGDGIR